MIHTPHRDKKRGASRSMDIILEHKLAPPRVVIDHVNEETVREVLDRGFWAAFSIYPHSKMTAQRMCDIVQIYGAERLIVDSACDWGVSDPLSVPKTAKLLAERGVSVEDVTRVTYANALTAYGQSGQMREEDWASAVPIDQRQLFQGNTVLRGGQTPRVETARN
jgi:predicted metal-dependent TIM-barrel fold hydrolase